MPGPQACRAGSHPQRHRGCAFVGMGSVIFLVYGLLGTGVCAEWRGQPGWSQPTDREPAWRSRPDEVAPHTAAPWRDDLRGRDWQDDGTDAYSAPVDGRYSGGRSARPSSPYEAGFERPALAGQPDWRIAPDADYADAIWSPGGRAARDPEIELDLGGLPTYGAASRPQAGSADFRFRRDPALPSVRSPDRPWGEQYRFRPLERGEGRRGAGSETHWRPWKSDSGDLPPEGDRGRSSLFDSMSGSAGSPPDPYSPWRPR